jgi:hypothetical protein
MEMLRAESGKDARLSLHLPGTSKTMWRALFFALGIYMCILGAECLAVDRFILAGESAPAEVAQPATLFGSPPASVTGGGSREVEPPEWAPWSLLSTGAVVILYALTINRQG